MDDVIDNQWNCRISRILRMLPYFILVFLDDNAEAGPRRRAFSARVRKLSKRLSTTFKSCKHILTWIFIVLSVLFGTSRHGSYAVLTILSLFIVLVPNWDFSGKAGKGGPYLFPILIKSPWYTLLSNIWIYAPSILFQPKSVAHSTSIGY